jgi:hypothetical protein
MCPRVISTKIIYLKVISTKLSNLKIPYHQPKNNFHLLPKNQSPYFPRNPQKLIPHALPFIE